MTKTQLDKGIALSEAMANLYGPLLKVRTAVDERKRVLSIALEGGDIDLDITPDEAGQAMLLALHDALSNQMARLKMEFSEL